MWEERKKRVLAALKCRKDVDELVVPILDKLNSSPDYYTTSSCAGRINIIEVDTFGEKKNAVFLGTWHGMVTFNEVLAALEKRKGRQVWLKSEPPIIHIRCRDLKPAEELLKIAYAAGFKYSSIKSLKKGVLVEINSSERLELPLAEGEKLLVTEDYLCYLTEIANKKIEKSHSKLLRLKKLL